MISEKIYLQLCKKFGLKMNVVKSICRSPFELIREEVDGKQRSVMINKFGKFGIKPYMKQKKKEKEDAKKAITNSTRVLESDISKQENSGTSTKEIIDMHSL